METTKERCKQRYAFSGSVWCDDHADIYTGTCDKITRKWGEYVWNNHDGKPTRFKAEAQCCDYLYIVCWNGDSGENGLLAEIKGDGRIVSGVNGNWEVYPTGIDYDGSTPRPSAALIEAQLKKAHCDGWRPVTVGQENDGSEQPFIEVKHMPADTRFIWYDSGNDTTSAYPPFSIPTLGFNHDEFLIFRLPIKDVFQKRCVNCVCPDCDCDCNDCHGCNENAAEDNIELFYRALDKVGRPLDKGCIQPYSGNCERKFVPKVQTPQLCFYLHMLDGKKDQLEEHDTEVFYLTVCNPYSDICFNGLRITKVSLDPGMPLDKVQIVPDRFISLDCLEPCSCATREFTVITRCEGSAGVYNLCIEYCYDSIEWKGEEAKGGTKKYQLEITED